MMPHAALRLPQRRKVSQICAGAAWISAGLVMCSQESNGRRRIKCPAYIHICRKEAHPHVSREPVRSPETSHPACKWWNYISSTLSVIQGLFCSMNPWNDVNSESISQGATLKGNIQVIYNSSPQPLVRGPVLPTPWVIWYRVVQKKLITCNTSFYLLFWKMTGFSLLHPSMAHVYYYI